MELRYLLKIMLLPPMSQFLLLLLAFLIRRWAKKSSNFLICLAGLSLWALASPVVAIFLASSLEGESTIDPETLSSIQADAIVILSATQNENANEFGEPVSDEKQLARIRYGAFLQSKTGLPVLLSGGVIRTTERRSNAETMAYDLENSFGGNAQWLEMKSRTTAENAKYSYEVLDAEQKRDIVLVTSALHMKRARWLFEKSGFTVLPAPTDFTNRAEISIRSFVPSAGSLKLSSQSLHEWLGLFFYYLVEMVNE